MKVYLVSRGTYSDYEILGVFSTNARAQEYIDNRARADRGGGCGIKTYVLDEGLKERLYMVWSTSIELSTGALISRGTTALTPRQRWGLPKSETYLDGEARVVTARSHKSAAHALKLAVEVRQAWLRERVNKQ